MARPMCENCSIQTNREAWAKYPDMLDLCKMCKSFQDAIEHTIEEYEKVVAVTANIGKKARSKFKP
jgi:hypothetical protein